MCAIEHASMLADEPFSDHPASVCPVVAAFMRSYNDHVDDERRRDLFRYAAAAVGTARGVACERQRAAICLHWASTTCAAPPLRVRLLHRLLRCQGPDIDGVYAARAAAADRGVHGHVLGVARRADRGRATHPRAVTHRHPEARCYSGWLMTSGPLSV